MTDNFRFGFALGMIEDGLVPRVIITDIVMPGKLQGPYLAKAARAHLPDVKIIYLSGYPNEASINGTGLLPGDTMLMKPVRRHDLGRCLQRLLTDGEG